ncbi:MAG: hypothetical protein V3R47_01055, partial [candidate division NC10 bacterium]
AKIFELGDAQIFALGGLVSGHTLKHLASAMAAYWILRMLQMRRPVASLADGQDSLVHPAGTSFRGQPRGI